MQNILQSLTKIMEILKTGEEDKRQALWVKLLPQLKEMTQRGPGYGKILLNIASLSAKDEKFIRQMVDHDLAVTGPLDFVVDYIVAKEPGLIPSLVSAGLANEKNILVMLEKNSSSVSDFMSKVVQLYGEDGLTHERKKVLNGMLYRELTEKSLVLSQNDNEANVRAVSKDEIVDIIDLIDKYKPLLESLGAEFIKTYMVQLYFVNHSSIQKEIELQDRIFRNIWSVDSALMTDFHKNLRIIQTTRLEFNKLEHFNQLVLEYPSILIEFSDNDLTVEAERGRLSASKKKTKSNAQKTPDVQAQEQLGMA